MLPTRPPFRTLRARLVGPTRRVARPFMPKAWDGLVEWARDPQERVDVEIRSLKPLKSRAAASFEVDFHAASGPPARWQTTCRLDQALEAFVSGIAAPASVAGPVSVDLVDYAHGLQGRDMQIRFLAAFPSDLPAALKRVCTSWTTVKPLQFTALHVCAAPTVSAIDLINACIPYVEALAPDGDIVWAATTNGQPAFERRVQITAVLAT